MPDKWVTALAQVQSDPELCLFWIDSWATCMKKAEWASWVQAVFSAAAVAAGAIGIWWQVRAQRRQAFEAPLQQELSAVEESFDLITHSLTLAYELRNSCSTPEDYSKRLLQEEDQAIQHLETLFKGFDVSKLIQARLKIAFKIATLAHEDLSAIEINGAELLHHGRVPSAVPDEHRQRYEKVIETLLGQVPKFGERARELKSQLSR